MTSPSPRRRPRGSGEPTCSRTRSFRCCRGSRELHHPFFARKYGGDWAAAFAVRSSPQRAGVDLVLRRAAVMMDLHLRAMAIYFFSRALVPLRALHRLELRAPLLIRDGAVVVIVAAIYVRRWKPLIYQPTRCRALP